jgi:hypothetical protein
MFSSVLSCDEGRRSQSLAGVLAMRTQQSLGAIADFGSQFRWTLFTAEKRTRLGGKIGSRRADGRQYRPQRAVTGSAPDSDLAELPAPKRTLR